MQLALQELGVCARLVRLEQSLIKPKLAARDVRLALLAVTARAVSVRTGRSPTMLHSQLPACYVRLAQLVLEAHVQTVSPAMHPTPTVQHAISARLVDTVLLESHVKRALILLTLPAHRMDALPTTSSTVMCVLMALARAGHTIAVKHVRLALLEAAGSAIRVWTRCWEMARRLASTAQTASHVLPVQTERSRM